MRRSSGAQPQVIGPVAEGADTGQPAADHGGWFMFVFGSHYTDPSRSCSGASASPKGLLGTALCHFVHDIDLVSLPGVWLALEAKQKIKCGVCSPLLDAYDSVASADIMAITNLGEKSNLCSPATYVANFSGRAIVGIRSYTATGRSGVILRAWKLNMEHRQSSPTRTETATDGADYS